MSFFTDASALVTQPPGSFVYHFVALLALEAALFISVGHWWRTRDSAPGRLALASGLALVGRLALLAVSLLSYYGVIASAAVLPPLDRALSAAVIVIVGWALIFPREARLALLSTLGLLLLTGLGYAVAAILWFPAGDAGQTYNGEFQETLWEIAQLGLLIIGLALVLIRRPDEWGTALGFYVVLLGGHVIHLIAPDLTQSLPAAVRLAELAALPLLAVVAYRRAIAQSLISNPPLSDLPPASQPDVSEPAPAVTHPALTLVSQTSGKGRTTQLVERSRSLLASKAALALASLGTALEPRIVCERVTAAVGRQMLADITLLLTLPDEKGLASVACGFDLIREQHEPGMTLASIEMPTLHNALRSGRPARLAPSAHAAELAKLNDGLGIKQTGPAMVVPILADERHLGAVMVMSPYSGREWNAEDQYTLTALIPAIAAALLNTEKYSTFDRRLADVQSQLEQARDDAQANQDHAERFALALDEAKTQLRREAERAARLQEELSLQSETASALQAVVAERARLEGELRQIRVKAAELEARVEAAQQTAGQDETKAALEAALAGRALLDAELSQTRAQVAQLQTQLEAASDAKAASAELALAVAERDRLSEELNQSQKRLADLEARLEAGQGELERLRAQAAEAETHASQAESLAAELQARLAVTAKAPSENGQPGGEVIASIAQELRQPMSSISGYTDLLLGESVGILGALQRKFLERVKSSTERMGSLLDDLVRVTAIDAGTLQLMDEAVDVTGVIDDAITGLGAQFREKGLTLRMDIAEELPTIKADRDAMCQIVSHLLSNAGQASEINGEVVLAARAQAAGDEQFLFLSVRDAGGGIPKEDLGRVFSRLYRADNPLIQGLGETGVGLSIAKALVEAHSGRIWVESETGVGSTFSVLLPVEGAGAKVA